jgi:hypothetical protein
MSTPATDGSAVESWDTPLRRAIRGSAQAGVETLRGARPSLFNAQTAAALTSVILAAFMCLAARFRSELAAGQLDLIASVLRAAALAFVVRAVIDGVRALQVIVEDRTASTASLALAADGLCLRLGDQEESVPRAQVLGISAPEALPSRTLPVRPEPILVSLMPVAGRPRVLTLPPYFAQTTEIALARLTRWSGASTASVQGKNDPEEPDGNEAPDAHYERAAGGQLERGDVVIPEGSGYLLRAPYSALLGLAFALDVFFSAGTSRALIATPVLAACLLSLLVLAAWFVWIARRRQSRRGIGMLFTRAELLLRGPHGVVAVPWAQLLSTELKLTARWSPFVGTYAARMLILTTNTGERMLFDRSFLGVPLEAIEVLCRHYRETWFARATQAANEP